ncbi:MAG: DUF4347 domain-containing protein [Nostoc sp.]|uniref:DUF4347 domain-containing protein n=1 Tax=Nostoc sp. TaxID=1180 RepID=UPI002FF8CCF9
MKNTNIIFIDSSVINYELLLENLVSTVEIVILDRYQDGVEQITEVLSQCREVESVHIISHGSPGCLYLGNTQLSLSTLQRYAQELQTWSSHLCVSPSLLLYGCNVAAGDAGEEFIQKLYKLTKASIAASANLTGNAVLGGDWNLEISRGEVTTVQIFKPEILETYNFVLASSNDNFANRIVLSGNSGNSTGNNVGATSESGEPIQSGTTNSVWWSWTAPASGNVVFNTIGSGFDTYLDVYTGNAVNSLTLVAANDDLAGGNTASQVSFTVTAGTTYHISVDGYQTNTGNITLNYSFTSGATTNTAPTLTDSVVTLNSINEDPGAPSGAVGTLVSSLVKLGGNISDPNSGAVTGIAITTANTISGSWWYSTNNGQNWYSVGTVSNSSARLLAADANTRVYFRPSSNFNGTINNAITFRAWDQTSGTNGGLGNTNTNGGSSAFSSTTDTAAITINAVNDAPVIAPIFFNIPENLSNGTIIRTLTATDVDSNTTLSNWAIASGNIDTDGDGNQAFSINPNTGELAVNDIDDLNPQTNPTVNLQVNVSDGIVTSANENVNIKVLLNPGDLDFNFGNGGTVSTKFGNGGSAYSVAIQPDGKIVAVGYVYMNNNNVSAPDFALARYNPDGSLDTSFGNSGTVTTHVVGTSSDFAYGVTLQSDGKIILAGYSWGDSTQPNQPDFALTRYNADGTLDTSFGNGGKVITNFGQDFGHNVLLQLDGKIILAGYIGNGNADYILLRYNTDGSLDTSFGNGGKVNGTKGYAVAIQPDGKIVVGGKDSNGSDIKFALTRYNTDGSLDTSFGNSGRVVAAIGTVGQEIHDIAIQPDGKIVAAGEVWKYVDGTSYNQHDLAIARFNTDGTFDANFGDGGKVITPLSTNTSDHANSLSIQSNGKIVVAGYIESGNTGINRTAVLLTYNPDGTLDSSFGTGGQVITSITTRYDSDVIATQSDGKIVIVGNIDGYFAVARYLGVSNIPPAIANWPEYAASYTENAPEILIAESNITVTDPDSANFHTGKLTVRIKNGGSSDDRLGIRNETQINLNGNIIKYGTVEIGTFSGGTGTEDLVINLNSNATPITVEALLRNVTYANFSENPSTTPRTIEVVLTDGDGGISTAVTRTINVTAVNDAPAISNLPSVTLNEDTSVTIAGIVVNDLDAGNSLLSVTLTATKGTVTVKTDVFDGLTLTSINNNSSSNVTFTGTVTQINATLADIAGLTYQGNTNVNGADILSIVVNDGNTGGSTSQNLPITINSVNDAAVITAGQNFSINESIANGTVVGTVAATDVDGSTFSNWTIIDGNLDSDRDGQVGFNINSTTGEITVNDSDDLDFETNPIFELQVTVSDGINTSSVQTVTVTLQDVSENILDGTRSADKLTGSLADDIIYGYEGSDRLYGETGKDTIYGGISNDSLYGGTGNDVLDGGDGNDYLYGQDGHDRLIGNAGNDYLDGGVGDDTLDGGNGTDSLNELGDVNFTLTNTQLSGLGSDVLISIEKVILTGGITGNILDASAFTFGSVSLYGGDGNDTLFGGSGNDTLDGGLGDDSLIGGIGNDIYTVDSISDSILESFNAGTDLVKSLVSWLLADNLENLTLTGSRAINGIGNNLNNIIIGNTAANALNGSDGNDSLIGGSSNDTLFGGSGNDTLDGGVGIDNLNGGVGDDIYTVDNLNDSITEGLDAGTDLVKSSVSWVLAGNMENLTLTGSGVINGTGNSLNNILTGNTGANILNGVDGNDSLIGSSGNDSLFGGAGDDTLDGGAGTDSLNGGVGNDIYIVDNLNDSIAEGLDAGIDLVKSSVSWVLGNNLENLTLIGTGAINGTGNSQNNILTGNTGVNTLNGVDGNDSLIGGTGNDTLFGGVGDDLLSGGTGKDVLTGGIGRDSLYLTDTRTGGYDIIADFTVGDDTIFVSKAEFGLSQSQNTSLEASLFRLGANAATASDRFIYNQTTGNLFFDKDGLGGTAQVQIAQFSNQAILTNANITVIA